MIKIVTDRYVRIENRVWMRGTQLVVVTEGQSQLYLESTVRYIKEDGKPGLPALGFPARRFKFESKWAEGVHDHCVQRVKEQIAWGALKTCRIRTKGQSCVTNLRLENSYGQSSMVTVKKSGALREGRRVDRTRVHHKPCPRCPDWDQEVGLRLIKNTKG